MKRYTIAVRADGSITLPAMLRIRMRIEPHDLVNVEANETSGTITLTIHHIAKGEPKP